VTTFLKKIFISFLAFIIFYCNAGIANAITKQLEIPSGTVVPITFTTSANSDRLYSGDIIPIYIQEDVLINNHIVFKKGMTGTAEAENVIRSGSHGRAGFIEITSAKIPDVNGVKHKIQLNVTRKGESRRASAITLSVLGVLLILIPFGIWREGTPAVINGNSIYEGVII